MSQGDSRTEETEANRTGDVHLERGGLSIGGELVPLLVGSVHYWRIEPQHWRTCLESVRALGMRFVDTYIPWAVHETAPGVLELGENKPELDIARFIRIAKEVGLFVIVRPGPHINAELTHFGIPERIVWDPACQARSPLGNPVVLPMLPVAFPVPSYASSVFLDETARFFTELGKSIVPLLYPSGPIVMVQVDNEGALYFRDGVYDQDYHPDAIAQYRAFLEARYQSTTSMAEAYGATEDAVPPSFAEIEPPKRFEAKDPSQLARHIDWAEFQEHLLASALERFSRALDDAGITGIPRIHNFPPGQDATPLNAARVTKQGVDMVGYDYYSNASPTSREVIARRTTELSVRTEAENQPAYACEMGAGFPPFFPPLDERDSAFTVMTALAYGLRGFNMYMAVERDRWIGAPIDSKGRQRPFSLFWKKLSLAIERTRFFELRRDLPVRILIPRNERRLARVTHAYGPLSAAFFAVMGRGARETSLEDDFGLGYPPSVEMDSFGRAVESALEARGVQFAHVGGEDKDISLSGSKWLIGLSSGGLSRTLFHRVEEAARAGTRVTVGPRRPTLGGARRVLTEPLDLDRLAVQNQRLPVFLENDPAAIDRAVAIAIEDLSLPTYSCEPELGFATVHEDAQGVPRVLFVINPHESETLIRVSVGSRIGHAQDLMKDQRFTAVSGVLEMQMKPKSVRMLAVEA